MLNRVDFTRLVLVHGLVAVCNLLIDFHPLAGDEGGLFPCSSFLDSIKREYLWIDIFKYFPSMLYWSKPEPLLWTDVVVIVSSLMMRRFERIACGVTYLILLSFSMCEGIVLWFPWDCLLFEVLAICWICPDRLFFKTLSLLLFRVMFGFGKHKFLGADSIEDLTYTASMACWQPLGTSIGWYLTWLPNWVHVVSILFTFFVEIICPFWLLWGGPMKQRLACASTIVLMAMIQMTGHFGWFNTLTALIAGALYKQPTTYKERRSKLFPFKALYIVVCVVFLIPSQWNSPSLFYQHSFDYPVFDIVRIASSWRLVHTYGVFPPKKMPLIKPIGVFEVNDGVRLHYHYQQSPSWPFAVAPLRFPRFDYIYAFYSASHVFSLGTMLGPSHSGSSGQQYIDSVASALLTNATCLGSLFRSPIPESIKDVRFYVIGLVPDYSEENGWREISKELDGYWTKPPAPAARGSFALGPNMISLRKKSKSFKITALKRNETVLEGLSPMELFDLAVAIVDEDFNPFLSERQWFQRISNVYTLVLGGQVPLVNNVNCSTSTNGSGLWDLCYSMKYGGYMGCLTSAHLLPPAIHSPFCPEILLGNAKHRNSSGDAYSKIPISDFHYWILGLGSVEK